MKTLIKNGRIITATDDFNADILIENEKAMDSLFQRFNTYIQIILESNVEEFWKKELLTKSYEFVEYFNNILGQEFQNKYEEYWHFIRYTRIFKSSIV